jgi:hypothetical protein
VPVKLKMLLDRLFSLLNPEEVTAVLRGFGWTIQDYQRGYILKVRLLIRKKARVNVLMLYKTVLWIRVCICFLTILDGNVSGRRELPSGSEPKTATVDQLTKADQSQWPS